MGGLGPITGPITEQMRRTEEGKPPALICEWKAAGNNPGDLIFLWAATTRLASSHFSWFSMTTVLGGGRPGERPVVDTPPGHVERLLAPLAHEGRVKILQALYNGPLTAGPLAEAAGCRGGTLYHHLRELKYGAYVTDAGGAYSLTPLGRQMLVTVTVIAQKVIGDRDKEGDGVGGIVPDG
ncbi:MAG: winged helix-turn-helix domain-containing protein [Planctomycetota bacterium]